MKHLLAIVMPTVEALDNLQAEDKLWDKEPAILWLVDWVKVLHYTRQNIGHFRDALSQPISWLVLSTVTGTHHCHKIRSPRQITVNFIINVLVRWRPLGEKTLQGKENQQRREVRSQLKKVGLELQLGFQQQKVRRIDTSTSAMMIQPPMMTYT